MLTMTGDCSCVRFTYEKHFSLSDFGIKQNGQVLDAHIPYSREAKPQPSSKLLFGLQYPQIRSTVSTISVILDFFPENDH